MTLPQWYPYVKVLHITAVTLSYGLFVLRGVWMLRGSERIHGRWVRVVPHVNDTVLLAGGVVLAITLHQYPGVSPWLTAKLVGLVIYIFLGMIAFRFGRRRRLRAASWLGAQIVFVYIIAVAIAKQPLPF